MRCHSTRCCSLPCVSVKYLLVATVKLHTGLPVLVFLRVGSTPRLPISCTLFMVVTTSSETSMSAWVSCPFHASSLVAGECDHPSTELCVRIPRTVSSRCLDALLWSHGPSTCNSTWPCCYQRHLNLNLFATFFFLRLVCCPGEVLPCCLSSFIRLTTF